MYQGDIGDKATVLQQDAQYLALSVQAGATVTVKNVAGDTLTYYNNQTSGATGTIAASSSQSFTAPAFLSSAGRSSVQITGTGY